MTDLLRRFVLLTVAATLGIAPLAHEFCQVSCATPVASTPQAGSGHEQHCAQMATDDRADSAKMSAARVSDCRSQTDGGGWTAAFVKVAPPAPAILPPGRQSFLPSARAWVRARASAPPPIFFPALTQLRV